MQYVDSCVVLNVDDPDDLAILISSGMVWKGGPKTVALAVEALLDGTVPRPKNLPSEVAGYLRLQDKISGN